MPIPTAIAASLPESRESFTSIEVCLLGYDFFQALHVLAVVAEHQTQVFLGLLHRSDEVLLLLPDAAGPIGNVELLGHARFRLL